MLFYSVFKTLLGEQISIELKNDIKLRGKLLAIDHYLNIKLEDIESLSGNELLNELEHVFLRGSMIRYIHLDPKSIDTSLLQDASRKEINRE